MMYSFKFPSFAVKIVYSCIIILHASSHTKNGHTVRLENMKKEVRRPSRIREEKVKNGLGETVCKKVDSIIWLSIRTWCGLH